MLKVLDYIFYRVYAFYKKNEDSTPIWMGALVISLILFLSILSIETLVTIFIKYELDINIKKLFSLVLMVLLLILIRRRYGKENISNLVSKYHDENKKGKEKHGWYIVLYLAIVISIPMVIGGLRHNLGWNI